MPSWTPIETDARWEQDGYYDSVSARCEAVTQEINQINYQLEREDWERQSRWDMLESTRDYYDWPSQSDYETQEEYDTEYARIEAEMKAHQQRVKVEQERVQLYLSFLHQQLYAMGARMMRPYEHWNEDEAYMQYMERDRDY